MENLVGKVIRGYEMHELIGEGGFGAVYRATQTAVDREVAIKVILPQYASRPEFIRKFEAEAKLVARLDSLHIVNLIDYWRDPEGAFLVLRWLKGGTLRDALREEGPWDPRAAAKLFTQIAAALAVAHRNNVVHRDVKPANILLDEEGNGYLSDFGIAHDTMEDVKAPSASSSSGSSSSSGVTGSAGYISPEQVNMQPVSSRSDIYSMTIVLYEMIAGHHPFPDARSAIALFIKHTSEALPILEDFPDAVNRVLQKGAAKNAEERYPDILEMAREFKMAVAEAAMPVGDRGSGLFIEDFDTTSVQSPLRDAEAIVNPYKGLRAFQEGDASDFYGREQLIQQLLNRMMDEHALHRFLAVVGPSGSGKSSVVKAGLIPALRKGAIPGSQNWFYIEMVPGASPIAELVDGLMSITANPLPNLALRLRASPQALHDAVWEALPDDDSELVIMVDQFEEAFTQGTDEERIAFLDNIQEAITAPDSRLRVFVTLRADFYDRPLMVAKFSTLMQQRTEVVVPLTIEELERAITAPARRVKVFFQQGLSAAIVSEVSEQPGVLPMMQYALTELFERREGQILTLSAYQELGGVLGALARRADEIYAELDEPHQEATRQLFLRLVTLGEGTEDTRRRVLMSELMEASADQKVMQDVVNSFGSFRLLTFDRDPVTRTPTVEVAHEALIREWKLLRQWLDEGRSDVRLQRMLSAAAADWQNANREPSFLLRGGRLVQFEEWIQRSTVGLTKNDREYFDASVVERDRFEAEETLRRDRELRNERRLRTLFFIGAVGGVVFSIVMGILGFAAVQQGNEAQAARATSDINAAAAVQANSTSVAQAGTAVSAQVVANTQAALATIAQGQSLYLAGTAVAAQEAANTQAARAATAQNRSAIDAADAKTQAARATFAQGEALVAADEAGTARAEAINQAATATFAQGDAINQAATATYAQGDAINQAATAVKAQELAAQEAEVSQSLLLSASAGQLASSNSPLALRLALEANNVPDPSLQAQRVLISIVYNAPRRRYVSEHLSINCIAPLDNERAATCNGDGSITIWDLVTGEVTNTLLGHTGAVNAISISSDGRRMASASQDGLVIVWDLRTDEPLFSLVGHESPVNTVAFNQTGSQIVSGSDNGRIIVWSVFNGSRTRDVSVTDNPISQVSYDQSGRYLLIAANDATRLWDIAAQQQLVFDPAQTLRINAAIYTPDNLLILTSGINASGAPEVWDAKTRKILFTLPAHNGPVNSLAADSNSRLVVTSSDDFSVILSDLLTGTEVRRFNGHTSRVNAAVFTPDGNSVLSGAGDGVMYLWDTTPSANPLQPLASVNTSISAAFFVPGDNLMATTDDGQITLWDGETDRLIVSRNLGRSELSATTLTLSPLSTASDLIIARGTTDLLIYNFSKGETLQRFTVPEERAYVGDIAFTSDGKYVAWGGAYFYREQLVDFTRIGLLRVWNVETGEMVKDFPNIVPRAQRVNELGTPEAVINEGVNAAVSSVAFNPDGTRLIAGFETGRILMWDMTRVDTAPLLEFTGHSGEVTSIIFNADGTRMLTGGKDRAVLLWDTASGSLMRRFTGHTGNINAIAFGVDVDANGIPTEIISASEDRSLRLWDTQTGESIQKFGEQDTPITAMALNPQTNDILIGTLDGELFVRRLDKASELRSWATDNRFLPKLSCAQRDQYRVQPFCTEEERLSEKGLDIFEDQATSTPLPPLVGTDTGAQTPLVAVGTQTANEANAAASGTLITPTMTASPTATLIP